MNYRLFFVISLVCTTGTIINAALRRQPSNASAQKPPSGVVSKVPGTAQPGINTTRQQDPKIMARKQELVKNFNEYRGKDSKVTSAKIEVLAEKKATLEDRQDRAWKAKKLESEYGITNTDRLKNFFGFPSKNYQSYKAKKAEVLGTPNASTKAFKKETESLKKDLNNDVKQLIKKQNEGASWLGDSPDKKIDRNKTKLEISAFGTDISERKRYNEKVKALTPEDKKTLERQKKHQEELSKDAERQSDGAGSDRFGRFIKSIPLIP